MYKFPNEFLLHVDRETTGHSDRWTHIYPPLDKRYSPIISMICGPNIGFFQNNNLLKVVTNALDVDEIFYQNTIITIYIYNIWNMIHKK